MEPAEKNLPPPQPTGEVSTVAFGWFPATTLAPVGLLLGRIVQILIQAVTFRVLTTLLSSLEVGRYYLFTAVQAWFSLFFLAAPALYLYRKFLDWKQERTHGRSLVAFILFLFLLSVACLPAAWLAVRWGWVSSPAPALTVLLIACWLFMVTLAAQAASLLNLLQRHLAYVLLSVGASLLALLLAFGTVKLISPLAEAWLGGYITAYLLAGVVGVLLLVRAAGIGREAVFAGVRSPASFLRAEWKHAWDFIWPITFIMAFYWAQSQGYRFALSAALGEQQVGLFVIAYSMGATVILVAESVLHQWILPRFYERIAGAGPEQSEELWRHYVARLLYLLLPLAAFATFAGPFLLKLLAGPEFQQAAPYALWGGAAESIRMVAVMFFLGGIARLKTREMVLPNLPGAIIAAGGAYVMGLAWNLHGVGLSLALSYATVGILLYFFVTPNLLSRVGWPGLPALLCTIAIAATLLAAWALGWRESFLLSVAALGVASLWLVAAVLLQVRGLLELMERE